MTEKPKRRRRSAHSRPIDPRPAELQKLRAVRSRDDARRAIGGVTKLSRDQRTALEARIRTLELELSPA